MTGRPRSRVDDVLAALDAGLQSSPESSMYNDVAPSVGTGCVRCPSVVVEGGELCGGCRAFLLGDSETDPAGDRCEYCGGDHCSPVLGMSPMRVPGATVSPVALTTAQEEIGQWFQAVVDDYIARFDVAPTHMITGVGEVRFLAPEGETVTYDGASDTYWAGRCLVCGMAEHPGRCTRTDMAEPLGVVQPREPESQSERARTRELRFLDGLRRSQRRTNRWGQPGR